MQGYFSRAENEKHLISNKLPGSRLNRISQLFHLKRKTSFEEATADIDVIDMIARMSHYKKFPLITNSRVIVSARTAKLWFQHEQQSYGFRTNSKVMVSARTAKLWFQDEQQSYGFSTNSKDLQTSTCRSFKSLKTQARKYMKHFNTGST